MTPNPITKFFSFVILVLVTGAIGVLFFEVVSPFVVPLFLAVVIVVMFRPLHTRCLHVSRGRNRVAAVMSTISVLLFVLLPSVLLLLLAANEAARLVRDLDQGEVRDKMQRVRTSLGLEYPYATELRFAERSLERLRTDAREGTGASGNQDAVLRLCEEWRQLQEKIPRSGNQPESATSQAILDALAAAHEETPGTLTYQQSIEAATRRFHDYKIEFLGGSWRAIFKDLANPTSDDVRLWTEKLFAITPDWISSLGGRAGVLMGRATFGVLILVVAMYFLFADGPQIAMHFMTLSPMEDGYEKQLLEEFTCLARAIVSGTIFAAIVQSALAGLGFWVAGFESVFLLTATTALTAIVPFVGAALVWLPAGLWLIFIDERPSAGITFIVYGAGVISTVDNLIKPWMLHGQSAMHPLAALIGILGGVQTIGPLGAFIGPMVVAFLQTLLSLLHRELTAFAENSGRKTKSTKSETQVRNSAKAHHLSPESSPSG